MDVTAAHTRIMHPSPQSAPTSPAAQQFEAMVLTQSVNMMLETVPEGSFGGGNAEKIWKSVLGEKIAEEIAQSGSTGIAQSVEHTLNKYKAGK